MPRIPKDLVKYMTPKLASARLIHLALKDILFLKPGVKVKWELKVRYHYEPEFLKANPEIIALGTSETFHSGDNEEGL